MHSFCRDHFCKIVFLFFFFWIFIFMQMLILKTEQLSLCMFIFLKLWFKFDWVQAPYENVKTITIWGQLFCRETFFGFLEVFEHFIFSNKINSDSKDVVLLKLWKSQNFQVFIFLNSFFQIPFSVFANFNFLERIALRAPPAETRLTVYRRFET